MSKGTAAEQAKALVLDLREQHAFMQSKSLFIPKERLAAADRLYLTHIELTTAGDTWFPDYEQYNWQEIISLYDEKLSQIKPVTFVMSFENGWVWFIQNKSRVFSTN